MDTSAPKSTGPAPVTRNGRNEADFLALVRRHAGIVRKVAASYGRTVADRHDLEQEILAQLWKSFPGYDGRRPFSTWMYRVALNVAISMARGRREHDAVPFEEHAHDAIGETGASFEREDDVRQLQTFIAALDELHRALIVLYLEGQSHGEIAEILGISETNVATKIHRVKQQLRERMNPKEQDHGTR